MKKNFSTKFNYQFNMKKIIFFIALLTLSSQILQAQKPTGKCVQGDCKQSFGIFYFENGDIYEGEWLNGMRHGQGKYTSVNKHVYSGQYVRDQRHGYGTYRWPEGDVYVGEYRQDKREGKGTYMDAEGKSQDGYFVNGKYLGPEAPGGSIVVKHIEKPAVPIADPATAPVVSFITPAIADLSYTPKYNIKACVKTDEKIEDVQVYVNNVIQAASRGLHVEEHGDCKNIVEKTVHLNPGENKIAIVVRTAGGATKAESQIITYKEQQSASSNRKTGERRTALVIGNSTYDKMPLKNPINDAVSVANTLTELGFDVKLVTDADQNTIKNVIRQFGQKLKDTQGIGMFYYAGHGIQANGNNYIIPVNANIEKDLDVETEGVDIGRIFVEMDYAQNPMNIVILDACRDNPFESKFKSRAANGLAAINRAPSGTFIAYSTSPGNVALDGIGDNGLYTQEFLKAIKEPNLRLEDVFKMVRSNVRKLSNNQQIPWENSSIEGDFYFMPK
jgi:hypothetical protein